MKFITLQNGTRMNADRIAFYRSLSGGSTEITCVDGRVIKLDIPCQDLDMMLGGQSGDDPLTVLNGTLVKLCNLLEKQDLHGTLSSTMKRLEAALQRLVATFPTSIRMHM